MAPKTLLLALANLLIPVALLIFATGFFPYKPFMPGLAEYEALGWEERIGWEEDDNRRGVPAPFDRLVFMVVDALRSDFVYSAESGMEFVQSLIRDGTAYPFTAHATSPTITMPRVKAMTTGSIPSFLDVILNFAESDTSSTLATQDTWLAQLRAQDGGKLVMYGDDTWLKLFPGFFARADGTSSFFVSDFTEVDVNVTRHVPRELAESDWNAMVLHYLGLDHIGHKAGPKSPNMVPKQREMDDIVRQVYTAIETQDHHANTLFVLCGDHGMNEGGNHGGSSPGETSPALVFMSPKLKKVTQSNHWTSPTKPESGEFEYYRMAEQSDIAPTLAGLLGFPVPRNNLGLFIHEFLGLWEDDRDKIKLLLRNARQIKRIVEATYPSVNFGDELHESKDKCKPPLSAGQSLSCKWQDVVAEMSRKGSIESNLKISKLYLFMQAAQRTMSSTASNYDIPRLILGTGLAVLSVILALFTLPSLRPISPQGIAFFLILVLYSVLMFASSYVEEEHNFWYWATSAWFFYLFVSSSRKEWYRKFILHPAIMLGILHRVIRRWNQTGQKFAGADDIVHSQLLHGSNSIVLWSMIGATYLDLTIRLSRHVARSIATFEGHTGVSFGEETDANRVMGMAAVLPLGGTAFVFKLAFTTRDAPELTRGISDGLLQWVEGLGLVGIARMVFGGLILSAFWITVAEWKRSTNKKQGESNGDLATALFDLTSLFLLTQTRAPNIPLFLLFRLQLFFLSLLSLPPTSITTTTLLLSQTSFFALANSNAISSIDLSNSYNGISSYNAPAVAILVFLSNWAGPIYFASAGTLLLGGYGTKRRHIALSEVDSRDWVQKEREHLEKLAKQEQDVAERRERDSAAWRDHVALLTLWTGVSSVSVMAACAVLRQHLFVWTVFSPKFLFCAAWGVPWFLGVVVGCGAVLWRVGRW